MNNSIRMIIAAGLKGGVGKTEVLLSLIPKLRIEGYDPLLLDFDIENANKSGLQNFYPEAIKLDVQADGALYRLLDICDQSERRIVVADLPAGASRATAQFIYDVYDEIESMNIKLTTLAVTNNDAGAVQSVLKYAELLQDKTEYIVVLNELREPNSNFEYWYQESAVESFKEALNPELIIMRSRIQELQAEMRNHTTTLQQIIDGEVNINYFRKSRFRIHASARQSQLFEEFDRVILRLLPPSENERA